MDVDYVWVKKHLFSHLGLNTTTTNSFICMAIYKYIYYRKNYIIVETKTIVFLKLSPLIFVKIKILNCFRDFFKVKISLKNRLLV